MPWQSYKQPELQFNECGRPTEAPSKSPWPRSADGCEQFGRMTVHRASFREWPDADRAMPKVPVDHELVGGTQEPMQNITSQRHDFVTKCLPEGQIQRATGPAETIGTNCGSGACPMTGKTTTADAFGVTCNTDGRRPLARPSTASWSQGPNLLMAKDTETSSSYQQWGPLKISRPQPMAPYCRSEEPVNGRTVYTVSYRPPGSFRDLLPSEQPPTDGYILNSKSDETKSQQPFYPRAHDYNLYP
ncbi:Uncharacterized protein FWK35_00000233 [Aphis craccivora]|uniref:Uncharacterized protein n=1 Tax=Aphis craccivora TaxID=307492 RepID=A0A6G0ZQZ3_APHCR|nr:Uncharacterized protein FWK35_00000233 [Aphis craccivora]